MLVVSTIIKSTALASYIFLVVLTVRSDTQAKVRRFFYIYLIGMIYWQFVSLMVNFSTTPRQALFWYNLLISGTGLYSVIFFPLTRAFLGIDGQRKLALSSYITAFGIFVLGLTGVTFTSVRMGQTGMFIPEFTTVVYILTPFGYFFWGLGVFNLIREYFRSESSFQKNRITYLLVGSTFVIVGTASNFTPLQDYPFDITLNLVNAGLIAYAVLRYRLLDIRLFLLRSVLHSIVTALLIGAYIGFIVLFESLLRNSIGYSRPVSSALTIFILAIAALPIRNRIQRSIDRLFFRERADYQIAIEAWSRATTTIRDPDQLTNLLLDTSSETVRSAGGFVMLREDKSKQLTVRASSHGLNRNLINFTLDGKDRLVTHLSRSGQPIIKEEIKVNAEMSFLLDVHESLFARPEISILVPITYENNLTGLLALGAKRSGALYTNEDVRFLTTLANQTALALDNAMIYAEIERRLAEQTLLFILSETFRRASDIDGSIQEILRVLENFLRVDACGMVYFERAGKARLFGENERVNRILGKIAESRDRINEFYSNYGDKGFEEAPTLSNSIGLLENDAKDLDFIPIRTEDEIFGLLVVPRQTDTDHTDQRRVELLRTMRSIISQGIHLQRTITNLVNVKSYNEHILNSLNDLGDLLIVSDLSRNIVSVNIATCSVLGYTEGDLVGKKIDVVAPDDEALFTPNGFSQIVTGESITNFSVNFATSQGDRIPMLLSATALYNEVGEVEAVVGIARDITEHIRAEETKKNLLMVKEIHHRIKNNLQVISSLLHLQSGYVADETTREMFVESQNRVRSMALIHERLYQTESLAGVEFGLYIENLVRSLLSTYGAEDLNVSLDLDLESDIYLGMDTGVPCGLLVNELVTNSFKHGFQGRESGMLSIKFRSMDMNERPRYRLSVSDNGNGLPDGFDIRKTGTLGLTLVTTLVRQLDGSISVESDGGTVVTVEFQER